MKRQHKKQQGFTLTELIVVIAIIAILAAVLIPSIVGYIDKARKSADKQEGDGMMQRYEEYLVAREAGSETGTFADYYKEIDNRGNDLETKKFAVHVREAITSDDEDEDLIEKVDELIYFGDHYAVIYDADNTKNAEFKSVEEAINDFYDPEKDDEYFDLAYEHLFKPIG